MSNRRELKYKWGSIMLQKNEPSTFKVKLLKRMCEMIPVFDDGDDDIHSFIPLACAECYDSLPFSGASSIPVCYTHFLSTLSYQLVFHPPSLHFVIYFWFYLSALFFPNSYIIFFGGNSIFFHYMPKPPLSIEPYCL